MGIRKEKAARLKIQILETAIKLIGRKSFDDLYVDDLCAKVKISKVTFFKYFPQKEDVLLYYFRVWLLMRSVELHEKPKAGLAGIYYVFDKLSEEFEARPGMVLSMVSYISDTRRIPKPFPFRVEEKVLLNPSKININDVQHLSLDQLLEKLTLEAILKKEITKSSSTRDITNLLITAFYGSIVSAHILQQHPVKLFFRKNLDILIKGLA